MLNDVRVRGRLGRTIRANHLRAKPLCVRCEAQGRFRAATELDHIEALSNGGDDFDRYEMIQPNGQGLCADCHKIKTAAERGSLTNAISQSIYPVDLKPSAVPLTILFGPPAAGKSTLAKQIAADTNATVIDLDNYFAKGALTIQSAMCMRNADLRGLSEKTTGTYVFLVGAATADERAWWRNVLQPSATTLVMCSRETSMQRAKERNPIKRERTYLGLKSWWDRYTPDQTPVYKTD